MQRLPHHMPMDRHQQIGDQLKQMNQLLTELQAELANTYGKSCQEVSQAKAAHRALLLLRSSLDVRVCSEHPSDPACVRAYFGA